MIAGLYEIEERKMGALEQRMDLQKDLVDLEGNWKRLWLAELRTSAKQRSRTAVETDGALVLAHVSLTAGILGLAEATDLSRWFALVPLIAGLGTTVFLILGLRDWLRVERAMDDLADDTET